MANKLFVLAALAAMMLTTAASMAFAQVGQKGVAGPQPVDWTGEEINVTGLLEPEGEKLDGTPVWGLEDGSSGNLYHVEQGEGVDLATFEGQMVSLHGSLGYLEGAVILVNSVERFEDETAVETQYEPAEITGEEFSGTGTVEYLDDKADGTPVYGLSISPEEGHYMEGDFDFAAFEGKQVEVADQIMYYYQGGRYLQVESIEPVGGEDDEDLQAGEETVPVMSPESSEVVNEAEAVEKIVAVELASEETPLASGGAADEPGVLSVATKALPATGGGALLMPLAGLILAGAGLAALRMTR